MITPAIELVTGSEAEVRTREWLLRLLDEHDVCGWMFSFACASRRVRCAALAAATGC